MFVRNICSVIYKSHVCSIISCSKTGCIELIDEFPHILLIPVIPIIPTAIIITGYNSRCNPCSLTKLNPALTANEYLSFPFRIYFGLLYVSCPEICYVYIYDKDIRTYVRWNLVFEDWKKKIEQVFDFVYFYFVLHIARRTLILMVFRRSKPSFWWFSYFSVISLISRTYVRLVWIRTYVRLFPLFKPGGYYRCTSHSSPGISHSNYVIHNIFIALYVTNSIISFLFSFPFLSHPSFSLFFLFLIYIKKTIIFPFYMRKFIILPFYRRRHTLCAGGGFCHLCVPSCCGNNPHSPLSHWVTTVFSLLFSFLFPVAAGVVADAL